MLSDLWNLLPALFSMCYQIALDCFNGLQAELAAIMGDLPVSLNTSATGNLGRRELLLYLAQLRELTKRSKSF